MIVYEECGWESSHSGAFFDDFDLEARSPRVEYYDIGRDALVSHGWCVFVTGADKLIEKNQFVGDWPEGADYVVLAPIQRIFPVYEVVKNYTFYPGRATFCMCREQNSLIFKEWDVKTVDFFVTVGGKKVVSIWE